MALRFVEELLILVEEEQVPNRTLRLALAGAALMDLALERRIDTDLETLYLTDATPLDDGLLDPVLAEIAEGPESQSCEFWVRRIAERGDCLQGQALARLEAQGIMESDDGGFFALALRVRRSRRYPLSLSLAAAGEEAEQEIRSRLMDILFNDDVIPSPRDTAIISLCRACGLFRRTLTAEEYDEVEERIELITRLERSARALTEAIRTMTVAEAVASRRIIGGRGGGWPMASGSLPILGHALALNGDLMTYLTEQYRKHGPVFGLKAPGRRFVAIAGPEANLFMIREGKFHLRNRETWDSWAGEMGASNILIGLDGAEHRLLRGTLRVPYSRSFILERLPAVVDVVDRELAFHSPDRPVPVFQMMQRLVSEQITTLTTGTPSREHVPDLTTYMTFSLLAHVIGRLPKLAMRLPRVRRARRNMELLTERVLRDHERQPGPEEQPDLVDNLVDLHRSHPDFMSEADLAANVIGPFLVGLESVAGIISFALYALQQHPEVAERVQREADEMFAAGGPTPELFEQMTATRWLVMETLRTYPIGVILPPRRVINSFEFAGYVIPHGTTLLVVSSIPHKMPEYFPDPERFDIDRYSPERREHVQPGVYVPFGLGHHSCMGQGFADVQMSVTIATLLHRADIVMDPPNYRMKMSYIPAPRPNRKFRVRLMPRR